MGDGTGESEGFVEGVVEPQTWSSKCPKAASARWLLERCQVGAVLVPPEFPPPPGLPVLVPDACLAGAWQS